MDEQRDPTVTNSSVIIHTGALGAREKNVVVNLVNGNQILVNPNQRTRVHDSMDLVELARQIQTADQFNSACATSKLSVIVEQIRFLQEQAKRVLEEARRDQDLTHVPCNFKKVPGNIYHLYEKLDGSSRLFSMLSPQEWGKSCPYRYFGSYKLHYDMSWIPLEQLPEKERDFKVMSAILAGNKKHSDQNALPTMLSLTDSSMTE